MFSSARHWCTALVFCSITVAASFANALTLVDNLSAPVSDTYQFSGQLPAASFTANADYSLSSVWVNMNILNSNTAVTVNLFADSAGNPASIPLLTLANDPVTPAQLGPPTAVKFDASLTPENHLFAGSTYWVVVALSGPGAAAEWTRTTLGGASMAAYKDGVVWNYFNPSNPASNPFQMRVDVEDYAGSPVPEPGTVALLGIGLLGLALAGRRYRK